MQTLDVKLDELPQSSSPASVSSSEHAVKFADEDHVDAHVANLSTGTDFYQHDRESYYNDSSTQHHQDYYRTLENASPFSYNKRMTGKKNKSSIVVGSDNKIEFDQMDDRGFGSVKINRPIGMNNSRTYENLNDNESVYSRESENSRTADGFFDLKFYSHPLW